jgi:opacity protein-like surface antigen
MKAKFHYILAASLACSAAALLGIGGARADGVARAPAAYVPPTWTGAYFGVESGWMSDDVRTSFTDFRTHVNTDRDVINAGLFAGYQRQFGSIVLGLEVNLIGNEFDFHKNVALEPGHVPNCPAFSARPGDNCVARIDNIITIGPRVGYAMGNWMPYVTGGWATGTVNFRAVNPSFIPPTPGAGVATAWADDRQDGFFVGIGADWKLASYAVLGIEYRHTDLGTGPIVAAFDPRIGAPNFVENIKNRADNDAILLRGSLLFGVPEYSPLK